MRHKCPKCNIEKDLCEYRPNKHRKNGYQAYCKECDKVFQKEWYQKNKRSRIEKAKNRNFLEKEENLKFVLDYLKSHPCVDCGENDPVVLEFDHLRDKEYTISSMIRRRFPTETIKKEISKCEVRCANCHRRKTAKQFNWYKLDSNI